MTRRLLCLVVGAAALLETRPALAARPNVPCRDPFAFADAAVNVVVMPYLDETGRLTETTRMLTLLIQQQLLLQIAPYGSVGTERFVGGRDECDLQTIRKTLLERYVRRPEQALVFVSGRIFQDGDEVRVQSFVSFERLGGLPAFDLRVGGARVTTEPPSSSVALMPRTLSQSDLGEVAANFSRNTLVYDEPRESGASRPLLGDGGRQTQYAVTDVRGSWMHIDGSMGSGWLKADAKLGASGIAQRMPELVFVEAVVGYLRSLPRGKDPAERARSVAAADAATRFATMAGDEDEQAVAWSEVIRALVSLAYLKGADALSAARSHLDKAAELTPEAQSVRIMRAAVLMKSVQDGKATIQAWRQAKKDLLVVTTLDGRGEDGRRYLGLLSGLSLPRKWSLSDQNEVSAERQQLRKVSEQGVAPAPPTPPSPPAPLSPPAPR